MIQTISGALTLPTVAADGLPGRQAQHDPSKPPFTHKRSEEKSELARLYPLSHWLIMLIANKMLSDLRPHR